MIDMGGGISPAVGALVRVAVLACLLSACNAPDDKGMSQPIGNGASGAQKGASMPPAALALEQAAADAGLVSDSAMISPIGLYRHRHEAGRDSLCLLPGKNGDLRFGIEASFGEAIDCQGQGTARLSGDRLIFNFARSACIIIAQYEGDRIVLPGALDGECRRHCSDRGSLAGVSFPRVSQDASIAAAAVAERGAGALCPAG